MRDAGKLFLTPYPWAWPSSASSSPFSSSSSTLSLTSLHPSPPQARRLHLLLQSSMLRQPLTPFLMTSRIAQCQPCLTSPTWRCPFTDPATWEFMTATVQTRTHPGRGLTPPQPAPHTGLSSYYELNTLSISFYRSKVLARTPGATTPGKRSVEKSLLSAQR